MLPCRWTAARASLLHVVILWAADAALPLGIPDTAPPQTYGNDLPPPPPLAPPPRPPAAGSSRLRGGQGESGIARGLVRASPEVLLNTSQGNTSFAGGSLAEGPPVTNGSAAPDSQPGSGRTAEEPDGGGPLAPPMQDLGSSLPPPPSSPPPPRPMAPPGEPGVHAEENSSSQINNSVPTPAPTPVPPLTQKKVIKTNGEHESFTRPVGMPDTRPGNHRARHTGRNDKLLPTAAPTVPPDGVNGSAPSRPIEAEANSSQHGEDKSVEKGNSQEEVKKSPEGQATIPPVAQSQAPLTSTLAATTTTAAPTETTTRSVPSTTTMTTLIPTSTDTTTVATTTSAVTTTTSTVRTSPTTTFSTTTTTSSTSKNKAIETSGEHQSLLRPVNMPDTRHRTRPAASGQGGQPHSGEDKHRQNGTKPAPPPTPKTNMTLAGVASPSPSTQPPVAASSPPTTQAPTTRPPTTQPPSSPQGLGNTQAPTAPPPAPAAATPVVVPAPGTTPAPAPAIAATPAPAPATQAPEQAPAQPTTQPQPQTPPQTQPQPQAQPQPQRQPQTQPQPSPSPSPPPLPPPVADPFHPPPLIPAPIASPSPPPAPTPAPTPMPRPTPVPLPAATVPAPAPPVVPVAPTQKPSNPQPSPNPNPSPSPNPNPNPNPSAHPNPNPNPNVSPNPPHPNSSPNTKPPPKPQPQTSHAPTAVAPSVTTQAATPATQAPSAPVAVRRPTASPEHLPQDFAKVERDRTWDESPYVSQARLDRLWSFLFTKYNQDVPPVPADGGPLPVGVGINFVKFKDFDEVSGTMNIALNLRLCWDDDRLAFNAREFFGIPWSHEGDKVPVRPDRVWLPDITVLNEVDGLHRIISAHSSPLVLSDDAFRNETGVNVLWSRPLDVKSNCDVDMSQYPFDEQRCYIIIGSWASSRRQMLLVPQPFFAEYTVHTAEFRVHNITVVKKDVYTRNTAQKFNEVVYSVVLQRFPHFYVINFILPMIAVTLLAIATMWMSPGNVGSRVNSSTKLLLCVVSIIFITARHRPAIHGDIWMDRFQSHCLALSMSSVLESLFIDYLAKPTSQIPWAPSPASVDATLRALICWLTTFVMLRDAWEVKRYNSLLVYASFEADSTRLLVLFIYIMFIGLIMSSSGSVVWIFLPRRSQRWFLGKTEEPSPNSPDAKAIRVDNMKEMAIPLTSDHSSPDLGRRSVRSNTVSPSIQRGPPSHWSLQSGRDQYIVCPTTEGDSKL